jgi:hypothetical protein
MPEEDNKERVAFDLMQVLLKKDTSLPQTKEGLIALYKECLVATYHKNWESA